MIRHQSILPWHTHGVSMLRTKVGRKERENICIRDGFGQHSKCYPGSSGISLSYCCQLYVRKWGNRYNFMIGATSEMLRQKRWPARGGMRRRYSDQGAPGRRGSDRAGGMC